MMSLEMKELLLVTLLVLVAVLSAQDSDSSSIEEPDTDLDLAFVIDATGSMSRYINQAKRNIQKITRQISSDAGVNIRLALVEYRDHPPQDRTFITRIHDFSSSVLDMQTWLNACSARGGGDGPEAAADAINALLSLSWRPQATKVVVLIADAPPHGLSRRGDGFINGCPLAHDPIIAAYALAERSIVLYTVGCEPSINPYKDFFTGLAFLTGGQYVALGDASSLANVIVGGAEEEISLHKWVPAVDLAVDDLLKGAGGKMGAADRDALVTDVYARLKLRGATVKHLQLNNKALTPATSASKEYAALANMAAAKALFAKKRSGSTSASGSVAGVMPPRRFMHTASFARGRIVTSDVSSYSAAEAGIDRAQVERLIQRTLAKRKTAMDF